MGLFNFARKQILKMTSWIESKKSGRIIESDEEFEDIIKGNSDNITDLPADFINNEYYIEYDGTNFDQVMELYLEGVDLTEEQIDIINDFIYDVYNAEDVSTAEKAKSFVCDGLKAENSVDSDKKINKLLILIDTVKDIYHLEGKKSSTEDMSNDPSNIIQKDFEGMDVEQVVELYLNNIDFDSETRNIINDFVADIYGNEEKENSLRSLLNDNMDKDKYSKLAVLLGHIDYSKNMSNNPADTEELANTTEKDSEDIDIKKVAESYFENIVLTSKQKELIKDYLQRIYGNKELTLNLCTFMQSHKHEDPNGKRDVLLLEYIPFIRDRYNLKQEKSNTEDMSNNSADIEVLSGIVENDPKNIDNGQVVSPQGEFTLIPKQKEETNGYSKRVDKDKKLIADVGAFADKPNDSTDTERLSNTTKKDSKNKEVEQAVELYFENINCDLEKSKKIKDFLIRKTHNKEIKEDICKFLKIYMNEDPNSKLDSLLDYIEYLQDEEVYNGYNETQNMLNNKIEELSYLREEFDIISKPIYGDGLIKNREKISIADEELQRTITASLREKTLLAPKEKLELLKEKLAEIKVVEREINTLCFKIGKYCAEYGFDFSEKYKHYKTIALSMVYFENELNEYLKKKQDERNIELQEMRNDAVDVFNRFNDKELEVIYMSRKYSDEELAAIYKYRNYEKSL